MAPSAEIGEEHALFQPSHGTAPQIAGQNMANPLAMILSAAMMLDWLGEKHNDRVCRNAAVTLEDAVARVLSDEKIRTSDMGGQASTTEMANAVADALNSIRPAG
jgi:3-isopropylmalate dehydrogenase